jgi:predicted TIM-barrel fold metal-dependent hydrolase
MVDVFHDDMVEALANLRPPLLPLPPGSCDVHAHVSGPFDKFPLVAGAPYRTPLSPFDEYIAMLDRVGTTNGVLIQPSACGYDNRGMIDALGRAPERLKGVAVVAPNVSDNELAELNRLGVRGIRFSEVGHPRGAPPPGFLGFTELEKLAPRIREIGWHAQVWTASHIIAENAGMLRSLRIPIVIDHMGLFDVRRGVTDPIFETLVSLLKEGSFWLKVTAFRNSQALPDMEDVRPFHEALVKGAPNRLVWGSDWPFIGMGGRIPNVGQLLDLLRQWTGDEVAFRKIMVENPRQLYGFQPNVHQN